MEENEEELDLNDPVVVREDDLAEVLDGFKSDNTVLASIDTYVLVKKFKKHFKPSGFNEYTFTVDELLFWINEIVIRGKISDTLMDMVKKGELDIYSDAETGEFRFLKAKK